MKTIEITTGNGTKEIFDVVPIKCKIGDTIYFDDDGRFLEGEVESINPEHWWIYDDGTKAYGNVSVVCTTKESHFHGQGFNIDAADIIYTKPNGYDEYWSEDDDSEFEIPTPSRHEVQDYLEEEGYLNDDGTCFLTIDEAVILGYEWAISKHLKQ